MMSKDRQPHRTLAPEKTNVGVRPPNPARRLDTRNRPQEGRPIQDPRVNLQNHIHKTPNRRLSSQESLKAAPSREIPHRRPPSPIQPEVDKNGKPIEYVDFSYMNRYPEGLNSANHLAARVLLASNTPKALFRGTAHGIKAAVEAPSGLRGYAFKQQVDQSLDDTWGNIIQEVYEHPVKYSFHGLVDFMGFGALAYTSMGGFSPIIQDYLIPAVQTAAKAVVYIFH